MPKPTIVTVIQARMGSSRLPGKVMFPVVGKPLLVRMIERVKRAALAGEIVVATTILAEDDVLVHACEAEGISVFRGDPSDLLDRHYQTALEYNADIVLKIPSDCPLIDPAIIDHLILMFLEAKGGIDYLSNLHPGSWPDGNDVEIMTMEALGYAWKKANQPHEREHTTPFLSENPFLFTIKNVLWETGLDFSESHRWTIDYLEDYQFINKVFEMLYISNPNFSLEDILELLQDCPEIQAINEMHAGKFWWKKNESRQFELQQNIKDYESN